MPICSEPGCPRSTESSIGKHCSVHHLKCMHCGAKAAFPEMTRPECTNCWEVRSRFTQFMHAEPNRQFVAELLVELIAAKKARAS